MAKLRQIADRHENVFFGILMDNPKNSFNVGAAIRTSGAFGGNFVGWSGSRYKTKGDWKTLDTEAAHLRMPCFKDVEDLTPLIPAAAVPVAIEMSDDAVSLYEFDHPANAVYFFGPEDGSLSEKYIALSKHKVYIPTKYSLNLAQTVNIISYDRSLKLGLRDEEKSLTCPNCSHNHYRIENNYFFCNRCGFNSPLKEMP